MKNRVVGLSAAAFTGLLMGLTGTVQAQAECASDSDCDLGFSCEVVAASAGCAVAPCMEGSDCPVVDCQVPEQIMGCLPSGDCQSDADCAEGYQCHTQASRSCEMPPAPDACPPGVPCPAPLPVDDAPECEVTEQSECVARWQLPCSADADCGSGFSCVEEQMCWCAAGGSADPIPAMQTDPSGALPMLPPDAGVDEPSVSPDVDCGCAGSGTFHCELVETACASDSDCGAGTVCLPDPSGVVCTGGVMGGGTDGDEGDSSEPAPGEGLLPVQDVAVDAGIPSEPAPGEVTCSEPRMLCMPPEFGRGVSVDSPVAQSGDGSTTGAPAPNAGPGAVNDAEAGGESFAELDSVGAPSGKAGNLGCSVQGGVSGASQLGLIGLCLLGLRRRRRL